ncbi:glycosyltransferase [Acaryochloris sp. IP29b_bin.137]|uniref:glycosyltransferase n=1 Tax=Acaryochloris sp. IP29b_bin.137 TaxID=2969217 RepID=UPI0026356013|nr:glycosyltransferase [Acaryochloris sp. IP29b_bin.137]
MDTYILSQRGLVEGSAYGFIFEFEELMARLCGSQILVPKANGLTLWVEQQSPKFATQFKKFISRTTGYYQKFDPADFRAHQLKVLFVICLSAPALNMVTSIPNWRRQFDLVVGFVIDAWFLPSYPKETYQFDHLFVPVLEAVDVIQQRFDLSVSLLPFGADVLLHGTQSVNRPVDVMSFGRTPLNFHQALSRTFNQPNSKMLYYRHPAVDRSWHPKNDRYATRVDCEYRLLFHQMMRRSKIVLAFDPLYDTDQLYESHKVNTRPWHFPHSILSLRWIEGVAAGCAILGKRPTTALADQALNWDDATIDLPDDPQVWMDFTQKLLSDHDRLKAIHYRNYFESLSRHDWRHRIRHMFETLHLTLPDLLLEELNKIAQMCS